MSRTSLSADAERRLRETARQRCGYCLSPQHLVFAPLELEHLQPRSRGGTDDEENLWLSCPLCNAHKSDKTSAADPLTQTEQPLFNPRTQNWYDHFRWSEDGLRIIGRTSIGRATVAALRLSDDPIALEVRSHWIAAGWHPPQ
jgi:HNH endonuclease